MTEEELKDKWAGIDIDSLEDGQLRAYKDDCFKVYETSGFSKRFHSPYDENHEHNGKPFKVVRRATTDECDLESMPVWVVAFEDEKEPYFCYPEEICKIEAEKARKNYNSMIILQRRKLYDYIVKTIMEIIAPFGGRLPVRLLYRYIDGDCEQSLYRVTEIYVKEGQLWMTVAGDLGESRAAEVHFNYEEDFGETWPENLSVMHGDGTAFDLDFIQALYDEVYNHALPREMEQIEKEI